MSHLLDRRRSALTGELLTRVALCFALIATLMLVTNFSVIRAMDYPDPDDALRMVQVRDLLAGQGWFDLVQHRIDTPGGGILMHWSRLVDVPIALIVLLLTPILGQGAAEMVAAIAVPLVTFACALLLVARIAWRLIGGEAAGLACLSMALSVPVLAQMRPLRIDHHGWQIVMLLVAVNALLSRSSRLGGLVAGLAVAAMLSISIEGLPMAAAICGIAALRWFRNRKDCHWLTWMMGGLTGGSAFFFLSTRGPGDLATYCDAISPYHIAIFAVGTLASWTLARLEPLPRLTLTVGFAAMGAAGIVIYALAAPQCIAGPFSTIDPVAASFWLAGVREGLPIWRQDLPLVLQMLIPAAIAIWASLKLAGQSGGWLRRWWIDYTLLLLAALLVTLLVARAGGALGALSAVPIGWQIGQWLRASRNSRRSSRRLAGMAATSLVLVPSLPVGLIGLVDGARAEAVETAPSIPRVTDCRLQDVAHAIERLPAGEIIAALDLGPQILLHTSHSVVATSHHRGDAAIRFQIDNFSADPAEAGRQLRARGTRYVMMCPGLREQALYAMRAPSGFMAVLQDNRAPGWMAPIALPENSGVRMWRVTPE